MADDDPTCTDPDKYRTLFENDAVRVLEYRDSPGAATAPHRHPDTVMYTLSSFSRRLLVDEATRDVEMQAGEVHWLPAQVHRGENTGTTDTHVLFVELKGPTHPPTEAPTLGPSTERSR
jgi:beta-alanine degradation protein BauB